MAHRSPSAVKRLRVACKEVGKTGNEAGKRKGGSLHGRSPVEVERLRDAHTNTAKQARTEKHAKPTKHAKPAEHAKSANHTKLVKRRPPKA